jgi:chromosome segregation ATPase
MYKCDDYESRLDMYKESMQVMDRKHQNRRIQKSRLKQEKSELSEKVQVLEMEKENLASQLRRFER